MNWYVSLVMGALVGFLADTWMARATVRDPLCLIIAVAVAVVVVILTFVGLLPLL